MESPQNIVKPGSVSDADPKSLQRLANFGDPHLNTIDTDEDFVMVHTSRHDITNEPFIISGPSMSEQLVDLLEQETPSEANERDRQYMRSMIAQQAHSADGYSRWFVENWDMKDRPRVAPPWFSHSYYTVPTRFNPSKIPQPPAPIVVQPPQPQPQHRPENVITSATKDGLATVSAFEHDHRVPIFNIPIDGQWVTLLSGKRIRATADNIAKLPARELRHLSVKKGKLLGGMGHCNLEQYWVANCYIYNHPTSGRQTRLGLKGGSDEPESSSDETAGIFSALPKSDPKLIPLMALFKMTSQPIIPTVPIANRAVSYTQNVKSPREITNRQVAPTYWFDPLFISDYTFTPVAPPAPAPAPAPVPMNNTLYPNVTIQPNNVVQKLYRRPQTTMLGLDIATALAKTVTDGGARLLVAMRGQVDLPSVATIMREYQHNNQDFVEETVALRLALLAFHWVDTDILGDVTSCVRDFIANANETGVTRHFLTAPAATTGPTPGNAAGTTQMRYINIDDYATWISGGAYFDLQPRSFVIVPVMRGWLAQPWIIPFIMAHTTSAWWNGAQWFTMATAVAENNRAGGLDTLGTFTMDGGLWSDYVFIPGPYDRILLVIVDQTSRAGAQPNVNVGAGALIIPVGYLDAALAPGQNVAGMFYTWLGRGVAVPDVLRRARETMTAYEHLLLYHCVPGVEDRIYAMTAMLAFRIRGNLTVDSGGVAPAVHGLWVWNHTDANVVARFPDFNANTAAAVNFQTHSQRANASSLNALGHTIGSWLDATTVAPIVQDGWYSHWPEQGAQYQTTYATPNFKILLMANCFQKSSRSDLMFQYGDQLPTFWLRSQGLAALLGACASATQMSLGISFFQWNRVNDVWLDVDQEIWEAINLATGNFCYNIHESQQHFFEYNTAPCVESALDSLQSSGIDMEYSSAHLPFYFVLSVFEKLGFKLSTELTETTMYQNINGYRIPSVYYTVTEKDDWFALSVLTSSLAYEVAFGSSPAFFQIDFTHPFLIDFHPRCIGFNWHARKDLQSVRTRNRVGAGRLGGDGPFLLSRGIIEPNMMIPSYSSHGEQGAKFVARVDVRIRSEPDHPDGWLKFERPLKYPDPFMDWLLKTGVKIFEAGMVGGWPAAITTGAVELVTPLAEFIGNKIDDWWNGTSKNE